MRKAVRILGIISVVLVIIGAVMRVFHFPGHGLLIVVFTGVFAGVVLPLDLLYRTSMATTRLQKVLQVLATLFLMHVVVVALFVAQGWAGWFAFSMQAVILAVAYITFYLSGKSKWEAGYNFLSPFNRFSILIVLPLAFFGVLRYLGGNESERLVQLNEIETRRYDSLKSVVVLHFTEVLTDSSMDSTRKNAETFRTDAVALIDYIHKLQMELANEINHGINSGSLDTNLNLQDPLSVGVPTVYFIGADVQNPTGKGIEMYDSLAHYRDHVLHADVPFFVPRNSTQEDKVQWVKDNFYHASAIEVMTRLTLHKENIYQSMQYSIDHNLFVQR